MITQVIYGVLWAVTIAVVSVIARWWKAHKDEESVQSAFTELQEWAGIVVRAAKDLGATDLDMTGEDKRLYAQRVLKEVREKLGLDITDEQIEMLVRHAYTVMCDESFDVSIPDYDEEDSFLDGE